MTDFRALCAELVEQLQRAINDYGFTHENTKRPSGPPPLKLRRSDTAASTRPGPTTQKPNIIPRGQSLGGYQPRPRQGTPTIQPVPAEPGVDDHVTDDEGTRWDRTTDAALWAKAFCLICPEMASREDVMIGWFANAIMAGCDHQDWKMDAELNPVPVSERLPGPEDCDPKLQRCWWLYPGFQESWESCSRPREGVTHWLPHWALPVPANNTREANQ
jgi:hypothetical protein